jgi:hypothetical protein
VFALGPRHEAIVTTPETEAHALRFVHEAQGLP